MSKITKNTKVIIALISSPIYAVYGLLPIYLFNNDDFITLLRGFVFLTSIFLTIWLINILIINFLKNNFDLKFVSISYISNLFWVFIAVSSGFQKIVGSKIDINLLLPLFSVFIFNSIILLILYILALNKKNRDEAIEKEKLKNKQLETQHRLLLQHIQPHSLFNMLSTLKSIIIEDQTKAVNFTVQLSNFLRNSLKNTPSGIQSVKNELVITKDFLNLQKARFDQSFSYQIKIPDEFLNYGLPLFTVQILVENAFKHNAYSSYNPLNIKIGVDNKMLFVKNNVTPKEENEASGTGLLNLNERSLILSNSSITIVEEDGFFEVKVPLINI